MEQSIFEKAKIHPNTLTLSSLLGVTDSGLGRPWPGSRLRVKEEGFPGGAGVKNLPANVGDTGSSPGPGRSHMPRSK